ncbi:GGDEF domain-containing protein, partial [Acinetobacter baumannii]
MKAISSRLRECTSPTDIVARLGGDEFVIIQSDVKRRADIRLVGNRLHQAMIAPFSVAGQRISISASVGIAHAPEHGSNAE